MSSIVPERYLQSPFGLFKWKLSSLHASAAEQRPFVFFVFSSAMAARPSCLAVSFLLLLLLSLISFSESVVGGGRLQPYQCKPKCSIRCSATSHKKPCMIFCQKCCAKCLCVPPGTYGNKQACPCYNNWKTQQGGPKCP